MNLDRGLIVLASTTISAQMEAPDKGYASILLIHRHTHCIVARETLNYLLFQKDRIGKFLPYINVKAIGR